MSGRQNQDSIISNDFKRVTCQAKNCIYFKWRATCMADYLELDGHGVCIHFQLNPNIKNVQPA